MNDLYRSLRWAAGLVLAFVPLLAVPAVALDQPEPPRTIDQTDPEFWDATLRRVADLDVEIYRQGAHRMLTRVRAADTDQALYLLQKALNLQPRDPRLLADYALASLAPYRWTWDRGEEWIDRAHKALSRARQINPDLVEVRRAGGLMLMLHGRLEEGEAELRRALEVDPDDLETLLILGANLRLQDRFPEAYDLYDRAAAIDPVDWRVYAGMADVYRDDHWYEEALNLYKKAGELNDRAFAARFGPVTVYQRLGFPNIANRLQVEVLREFPEFADLVLLSGAAVHMQTREYEKALQELEQIDMGGRRGLCQGTVVYRSALCHMRTAKSDVAIREFRNVIEDYPEARDGSDYGPLVLFPASRHLALLYDDGGEPEKANEILEIAAGHPEAPISLPLMLAERYASYHLFDRAAEALRRGLAAETSDDRLDERLRLRVDLARALAAGGSTPEPGGLEEIAAEVESDGTPLDVYLMARGLSLSGRETDALGWLERAIDRGFVQYAAIRREPDLDPVRELPRYQDLLRGK